MTEGKEAAEQPLSDTEADLHVEESGWLPRREFKRPDPSTVAWVLAVAGVIALLIYIQSQLP